MFSYVPGSLKISPAKGVFSVAEQSYLQVNCSSPNGVRWSANPPSAMSSLSLNQGSVTANGDNISTLTFEHVATSHAAIYRCTDETTSEDSSFELKVFTGKCFQYLEIVMYDTLWRLLYPGLSPEGRPGDF